jgi:hypothetical protein
MLRGSLGDAKSSLGDAQQMERTAMLTEIGRLERLVHAEHGQGA